ncbi:MAG TPA: hypothetical protein VHR45_04720 [Thermoanaerobaculia bacterium]|nr:hypothetical protein [Thermoanaerobaculia bacterium]
MSLTHWVLATGMAALAVAPPAGADGWAPDECGPELAAALADSRTMLARVPPGSKLWLPHPYPAGAAEILEDFRAGYLGHLERAEWGPWRALNAAGWDLLTGKWRQATTQARAALESLRPDSFYQRQERFREALAARQLTCSVDRVENWTPRRCTARLSGDESLRQAAGSFGYLLRLRDAAGAEVARAALSQSGQWRTVALAWHPPGQPLQWPAAPPRPEEVLRQAAAALHLRGSRPQYVEAQGTIDCMVLQFQPCVAFLGPSAERGPTEAKGVDAAGESTYLASRGMFFEIRPDSPRFPAEDLPRRLADGSLAVPASYDASRDAVITIGRGQAAIARRLEPVR